MKYVKPTESELEILQIVWALDKATVREVHDIILKEKNAGYTTTLKLMQIMLDKGILKREQKGKQHVYEAVYKKEDTQSHLLQHMIDNVFNGSASGLVMQALGNEKTTKEEIEAIRKYLDTLKNK